MCGNCECNDCCCCCSSCQKESCAHDFGWALNCLKQGKAVTRRGWNGKGMFLTLQPGSTVDGQMMRNEPARQFYEDGKVKIVTHIDMMAADGTYVVGWLASQADLLAEDWDLIPEDCELAEVR